MTGSVWNPGQYERFRDERSKPFFDLMSMVRPQPGASVIDLGCGTGELTRALHDHVAASMTLGLDNSETMLEKSRQFAGNSLSFAHGDAATWAPDAPADIVFSNAALQWLPDHESLFPRLMRSVAPGGQFAVQMPANNDHPSHVTAHWLAFQEPFRTYLGGYVRSWPVMAPEWYAELLDREGFVEQTVLVVVYGHHLGTRDDVVEWVKGTLLTDYEKRMTPGEYAEYLDAYRAKLLPRLADTRPFFYPFKRILMWARKA